HRVPVCCSRFPPCDQTRTTYTCVTPVRSLAKANSIPIDGSTIAVYIDGLKIGRPIYNHYREDIAELFPGYANSNGAVGYFYLDTAKYKNGVHTIQWTAADNAGNTDGIGSRYFTVMNTGAGDVAAVLNERRPGLNEEMTERLQCFAPALVKKGYSDNIKPDELYPDEHGVIHIEIAELERVEIKLENFSPHRLKGYLRVGDELRELPIGATLDRNAGVFYWQPGVGFIGKYYLVFTGQDETGRLTRKDIVITIAPKAI
ncbi:MAG TPA: hypothetical protein VK469_07510, partial [Candidatus Kapabacteria bacterium]|nr:hypothetical protein [Candidatus Kapabacteria bacterium]